MADEHAPGRSIDARIVHSADRRGRGTGGADIEPDTCKDRSAARPCRPRGSSQTFARPGHPIDQQSAIVELSCRLGGQDPRWPMEYFGDSVPLAAWSGEQVGDRERRPVGELGQDVAELLEDGYAGIMLIIVGPDRSRISLGELQRPRPSARHSPFPSPGRCRPGRPEAGGWPSAAKRRRAVQGADVERARDRDPPPARRRRLGDVGLDALQRGHIGSSSLRTGRFAPEAPAGRLRPEVQPGFRPG